MKTISITDQIYDRLKSMAGEQSTDDYVADVLESSPYWYPQTVKAGDNGSPSDHGDPSKNSDFALAMAAQTGDHAEYRRIREKQKAGME